MVMMSLSVGSCMASTDPTAPLGWRAPNVAKSVTAKPAVRLNVQSIVCPDKAECHAIINQRVLSVNDYIAGHRIQAIDQDGVWLFKQGRRLRLTLFPNVVIR